MIRFIHLVRHGEHDEVGKVLSGRSEIALNVTGLAEAEDAAEFLNGTAIASLHASPRRRTQETALRIAQRQGLATITAPALDEIDFGAFTGQTFAALAGDPDWERWNAERGSARCPGGETMGEAVARARTYLSSIPAEQTPAVCVSHCDIIRGLVADALGMDLSRMFAFDCDPGSVTTLALGAEDARLVRLNARVRR